MNKNILEIISLYSPNIIFQHDIYKTIKYKLTNELTNDEFIIFCTELFNIIPQHNTIDNVSGVIECILMYVKSYPKSTTATIMVSSDKFYKMYDRNEIFSRKETVSLHKWVNYHIYKSYIKSGHYEINISQSIKYFEYNTSCDNNHKIKRMKIPEYSIKNLAHMIYIARNNGDYYSNINFIGFNSMEAYGGLCVNKYKQLAEAKINEKYLPMDYLIISGNHQYNLSEMIRPRVDPFVLIQHKDIVNKLNIDWDWYMKYSTGFPKRTWIYLAILSKTFSQYNFDLILNKYYSHSNGNALANIDAIFESPKLSEGYVYNLEILISLLTKIYLSHYSTTILVTYIDLLRDGVPSRSDHSLKTNGLIDIISNVDIIYDIVGDRIHQCNVSKKYLQNAGLEPPIQPPGQEDNIRVLNIPPDVLDNPNVAGDLPALVEMIFRGMGIQNAAQQNRN